MYIISGIINTEGGERFCTVQIRNPSDRILIEIKKRLTKERKAQYYLANQERLKRYAKRHYKPKPNIERKRFTVVFEKKEGGYRWTAYVRNNFTGKLVKFESAKSFERLKEAKSDYLKAIE